MTAEWYALALEVYLQNLISPMRLRAQPTHAPTRVSPIPSNAFKGVFTPASTPTKGPSPPSSASFRFTGCAALAFKFLGTAADAVRG